MPRQNITEVLNTVNHTRMQGIITFNCMYWTNSLLLNTNQTTNQDTSTNQLVPLILGCHHHWDVKSHIQLAGDMASN